MSDLGFQRRGLTSFFIHPSLAEGSSGSMLLGAPGHPHVVTSSRVSPKLSAPLSSASCREEARGRAVGGRAGPGTRAEPWAAGGSTGGSAHVPGHCESAAPGDRACSNLPRHPAPAPMCVRHQETRHPKLSHGHPPPRPHLAPRSLQTEPVTRRVLRPRGLFHCQVLIGLFIAPAKDSDSGGFH